MFRTGKSVSGFGPGGPTQEELNDLHTFAEGYRAKMRAERQQVQEERARQEANMRESILGTAATYRGMFATMKRDQRETFDAQDGMYIVIERYEDRLRMARTSNPPKSLGGYLPGFDDVADFQEIFVTEGKDPLDAVEIFYWDKETLGKLVPGAPVYESAKHILLGNTSKLELDELEVTTEALSRTIPLPKQLSDNH